MLTCLGRLSLAVEDEARRQGLPFSKADAWFRIELDAKRVLVVRGNRCTTAGITAIYGRQAESGPQILEVHLEVIANGAVSGWRERGTVSPLYDDDTLAAVLLSRQFLRAKSIARVSD